MPKIIELTVEIVIQRVSCPGVWLCQDGSVSLIVFALGTSYETCKLPPVFPIQFNDKLYFRKRFEETCTFSNMCCVLKDETLYCELVQWCQDCDASQCNILAQYLGSLSDVLFPPKMCCSDGVDLLMRRSKTYPGILSPKIEIITKVRMDEVWNDGIKPFLNLQSIRNNVAECLCMPGFGGRQKSVCHSAEYHRNKCGTTSPHSKGCRSRSRSRSGGSGSYCSLIERMPHRASANSESRFPSRNKSRPASAPRRRRSKCQRDYCVFNVKVPTGDTWNSATGNTQESDDTECDKQRDFPSKVEDKKALLESQYVDNEDRDREYEVKHTHTSKKCQKQKYKPCVCEICQRYHELFHSDSDARIS